MTVFQFLENLTDCQVAQAVLTRLDWKYALSMEITDPSFDFSVLSEFRSRLVEGKAEHLMLDKMLARFREQGLLKLRGKQRTDATHVLYSVRTLNRLEWLGETFRAALNELAKIAPEWLKPRIKPQWLDWLVHRVEEHRIVKGKEAREAQAVAIGEDGFEILAAQEKDEATKPWLDQPALKALKLTSVREF